MGELSHLDEEGRARMVDVSDKAVTQRTAAASCVVAMGAQTLVRVRDGAVEKGDVLAVAKVAAIQAVKRTGELVPLCHPVRVTGVDVDFAFEGDTALVITVTARASDRTGVEMEAMTGAAVAGLTVYDMIKAVDRDAAVGPIRLEHKAGGAGGEYVRSGE